VEEKHNKTDFKDLDFWDVSCVGLAEDGVRLWAVVTLEIIL
jgi:hypothetical protein